MSDKVKVSPYWTEDERDALCILIDAATEKTLSELTEARRYIMQLEFRLGDLRTQRAYIADAGLHTLEVNRANFSEFADYVDR